MGTFEKKDGTPGLDNFSTGFEFKFSDAKDQPGYFEGYASVYNVMDGGGDIATKGMFTKSLKSRPAGKVKMLYQHSVAAPIGVWDEIREDSKGLFVRGHLLLEVPEAKTVHTLMLAGALDGMSIGFRTKDADINRSTGARVLKQVDLWEISIVTFPMNTEATVTAVKGDDLFLRDARKMEKAFRDGGLSATDAKIAVSVTKKMVQRDAGREDQPEHSKEALQTLLSIRRATEMVGGK